MSVFADNLFDVLLPEMVLLVLSEGAVDMFSVLLVTSLSPDTFEVTDTNESVSWFKLPLLVDLFMDGEPAVPFDVVDKKELAKLFRFLLRIVSVTLLRLSRPLLPPPAWIELVMLKI